jgi:hypothetical protein
MAPLRLRVMVLWGLLISPFYIMYCICSTDSCNPIALSYEHALSFNMNQPRLGAKRINLRRKRNKNNDRNYRNNDDNPASDSGSQDRTPQVDTNLLLASINSLQNDSTATSPVQTNLVQTLDKVYRGSHESWFSPVVVESHKLVFFLPPPSHNDSSAATWKQLFYKLLNATATSSTDMDSQDLQLQYLQDYSLREADEIMTSPHWTRAYFVQDPREWFMAAYNNLVLKNEGRYLLKFPAKQPKCCKNGQTRQQCFDTITANPHKFIAALGRGCTDPNWDPQILRMEHKYWPYINFIRNSHHSTIAQDAQTLLQKIGAWETFGKTGWGDDGQQPIFLQDYTEKQRQIRRWYSYNLENKVHDYYHPDYQHFNLSWVPMYPQPTETDSDNSLPPPPTTSTSPPNEEGKLFSL